MKMFAISFLMGRHDGDRHTSTHVLSLRMGETQEEAIGRALPAALELKPGFSVSSVIALPIAEQE